MSAHVHIGAGRLGLGFCIPAAANWSVTETVLANRRATNKKSEERNLAISRCAYAVKYFGGAGQEDIRFDEFIEYDTKEDRALVGKIASPDTILLTTAVGRDNLRSVALHVARGLEDRPPDAPVLYILPLENGRFCGAELREQVAQIRPEAVIKGAFVNAVVDQICREVVVEDGRVVVYAERDRELLVGAPLENILKGEGIRCVPAEHVEMFEIRKRWLVNGTHLALAIVGMYWFKKPKAAFADVLQAEGLSKMVEGIMGELAAAVEAEDKEGVLPDLRSYRALVKKRLAEVPDTVGRVLESVIMDAETVRRNTSEVGFDLAQDKVLSESLGNFSRRIHYSFIEKLNGRICEPINVLVKYKSRCEYLHSILVMLMPILAEQGRRWERAP